MSKPLQCDLLLRDGRLLTRTDASIMEKAFVAVADGSILAVGAMDTLPGAIEARKVLDCRGQLIMPGLVNGHCHAAMTLFRGMADDLPLFTWLNDHIFPAEARYVSPEMVYWCTKLAAAEMLLSGTTTVADSYFFETDAARAFVDVGIRAVAAQGIIDFPAPGVPDPLDNINAARDFLIHWQHSHPRISPAIFCHSPYTCSAETLKKGKALAAEIGVRFFVHVAETAGEVEQSIENTGKSPVQFLESLGVLDATTVCVHVVYAKDDDIALLRENKAAVIHCPESNMKLASGCAPLTRMADISLAIGTDGPASNNDLDLFGEMRSCANLHKVVCHDPTVMAATKILDMATVSGAAALGLDEKIGTIEVGKKADIICLDMLQPHLTPFYNQDILVYAGRGSDVQTVIVDGRVVVENRHLTTIDIMDAMERVTKLAEQLR